MSALEELKNIHVDVIIPIYHPDDKLNQLLSGMKKQTIRPKNIIILQTCEDRTVRKSLKFLTV